MVGVQITSHLDPLNSLESTSSRLNHLIHFIRIRASCPIVHHIHIYCFVLYLHIYIVLLAVTPVRSASSARDPERTEYKSIYCQYTHNLFN